MDNTQQLFQYTIDLLSKFSIKHEAHSFPSGAIMLDVWHNNKFYVLQFENNLIGFSEINDNNIGFDTTPNEKFYDEVDYKKKIESILKGAM